MDKEFNISIQGCNFVYKVTKDSQFIKREGGEFVEISSSRCPELPKLSDETCNKEVVTWEDLMNDVYFRLWET